MREKQYDQHQYYMYTNNREKEHRAHKKYHGNIVMHLGTFLKVKPLIHKSSVLKVQINQ